MNERLLKAIRSLLKAADAPQPGEGVDALAGWVLAVMVYVEVLRDVVDEIELSN